jgi:hypothetical protein
MRRFSLRALMLAVTAICIFCAYEVHWCNQRRDYLLQWHFPGWPANRHQFPTVSRRNIELNDPGFSDRGAPYLLWLFGERRAEAIWVSVGIKDVTRTDEYTATINRSHPALKRAMRLFPEAKVWTVVCEEVRELEVQIVD